MIPKTHTKIVITRSCALICLCIFFKYADKSTANAALIPFSANVFITAVKYKGSPLQAFLATSVPAQMRAIAHLVMDVGSGNWRSSPSYIGMLKLNGLRKLHLVLPENFYTWQGGISSGLLLNCLEYFDVGSLSQLDLRSAGISFMFTGGEYTFITVDTANEIEEFAKGYEKEILDGPDVYLARKHAEREKSASGLNARRASVRYTRRLRPLADVS